MHREQIKILVLDDDFLNLEILIKNLEDAGFSKISDFDNGLSAWNFIENNFQNIDILILDKMMPEPDGLEILKRIKAKKELKHLPIIIQTGDAASDAVAECIKLGASSCITKPYKPETLVEQIGKALGQK